MERTFTLEEAHLLLPEVKPLLALAMEEKKGIDGIAEEFRHVAGHIISAGGCELDVVALARRKAERDKAVERLKESLAEIDELGVQVKDLDIGLLDFPCLVDGETILLCWKMGEDRITFWHGLEEGYAGRKPITDKIAKAKPPDRPN